MHFRYALLSLAILVVGVRAMPAALDLPMPVVVVVRDTTNGTSTDTAPAVASDTTVAQQTTQSTRNNPQTDQTTANPTTTNNGRQQNTPAAATTTKGSHNQNQNNNPNPTTDNVPSPTPSGNQDTTPTDPQTQASASTNAAATDSAATDAPPPHTHSDTQATNTQTSPSSTSTDATENSQSPQSSNSSSNNGTKTILIIGGTIGGVIIVAFIGFSIFRKLKLKPSRAFEERMDPVGNGGRFEEWNDPRSFRGYMQNSPSPNPANRPESMASSKYSFDEMDEKAGGGSGMMTLERGNTIRHFTSTGQEKVYHIENGDGLREGGRGYRGF